MTPLEITLLVLGILVGGGILFGLVPTFFIARKVYNDYLVRHSREDWARGKCSCETDAEQMEMFRKGMAWHDENAAFARPVEQISEGYHLYGEYYDFGFSRAAVILAGRTEALTYSYYFAAPYRAAGFNVLVIDARGHGNSDGKYQNVGLREYRDVIGWVNLLHDELGNEKVVLHGICIGSANAIYAATAKDRPACLSALITDGMYTSFGESFKNHMIDIKKPVYPVLWEVMFLMRLHAGRNPARHGPIRYIGSLDLPILMLYGKCDKFSVPAQAEALYEKCGAKDKTLVWFGKGGHSHLRINDEARYDAAVTEFLHERFPL